MEFADLDVVYAPIEWIDTVLFALHLERLQDAILFEANANSIGSTGEYTPVVIRLTGSVGETERQQCLQVFGFLVFLQVVRVVPIVPLFRIPKCYSFLTKNIDQIRQICVASK